jgi:hypothetical protein
MEFLLRSSTAALKELGIEIPQNQRPWTCHVDGVDYPEYPLSDRDIRLQNLPDVSSYMLIDYLTSDC